MPNRIVTRARLRLWPYAAPLALVVGACGSNADPDAPGGGAVGGTGMTGMGGAFAGNTAAGTENGGTSSAGRGSGGSSGTTGGGAGSGTLGASGSSAAGGSGATGGDTGTGGSGVSGSGQAEGGTGDVGANGGTAGASASGGTSAGSGGENPVTFSKPEGTIPNEPQPPNKTDLPESQWEDGLISPSMDVGHQINQPSVLNGYLVIGGNEEFWFYDVSNPAAPRRLSNMTTPNRTGAEAESHTISFARYGDTFYMVTIGGRGIDTWDVTDASAPRHLAQLRIDGTNYGDYTEAVWGVTWQGQYIYVGATNNGIKVVDAADPTALEVVAEVPTSQYGGVSAGPVEAVGNVLVVTTPKESAGIATLDISNPLQPSRLSSLSSSTKSYIGMFYRRWVFLIDPVRAWDVLSNPRSIGSGSSPIGSLTVGAAEYMSFSDDYMFLGHVRKEIGGTPGASKISVDDPRSMQVTGRVWGRQDLGGINDDQFSIPFGNLLVLGDDQAPYAGWVIAVHQADPDTIAPVVDTVLPGDQATAVATTSAIGISFSDNIELATVNAASFMVRPVGGQPLAGKYGVRMGVLNFDPDDELESGTTYEVVLPAGGIADLVGNTLTTEWKSTFTTN
jgi:hypothetical protein